MPAPDPSAQPPDDRPNLLAVASVVVGAGGLVAYVCVYPVIFMAGLVGIVGLVLAWLGRQQVREGAAGRDYVWWGTLLGLGHLVLGLGVGVLVALAALS